MDSDITLMAKELSRERMKGKINNWLALAFCFVLFVGMTTI